MHPARPSNVYESTLMVNQDDGMSIVIVCRAISRRNDRYVPSTAPTHCGKPWLVLKPSITLFISSPVGIPI